MRYVTVLHCKDDESDIVDEFWNLEEGNSGPEERWSNKAGIPVLEHSHGSVKAGTG